MLISLDIFAAVFHRILDYKWGWISILAPFLFKCFFSTALLLPLKKHENLLLAFQNLRQLSTQNHFFLTHS